MDIVINCLGMPFDGDTINNRSLGGSETAAYYMALELVNLGHRVTVFTRCEESKTFDGVKYVPAGEQTEANPLGSQFHYYAENTPHDVLIIQRHPSAFAHTYASKINLWWCHDLAMYRNRDGIFQHLWNVDGVLAVSDYHKDQINEVYGIDKSVIHVIRNGVDLKLFEGAFDVIEKKPDVKYLLYSSRPERGLEHLVAPGGIMEELASDNVHLLVCGYDNPVPHMAEYHAYLNQRIDALPNCSNIGALTKQQLADLMRQVDLHVYPTPGPGAREFREVSCITVMECMAAGLPMVTSECGAIPETAKDGGMVMLPLTDSGIPDIKDFADSVRAVLKNHREFSEQQLFCANRVSWHISACDLDRLGRLLLSKKSKQAMLRHWIDYSDIPAYERIHGDTDPVSNNIESEYQECYQFYRDGTYEEHYKKIYDYEAERGITYGRGEQSGSLRYQAVFNIVATLPAGSKVLDYGCAHGPFTNNLAKRFPELTFVGMDICKTNIETATKWAEDEQIENVSFMHYHLTDESDSDEFDCVIAAEVVEHVGDYVGLLTNLCRQISTGGKLIITTPYGPWESIGYRKEWPLRAHLHHFERRDIDEIFADFNDLNVVVAPYSHYKDMPIGSYVYSFTVPDAFTIHECDYSRKLAECMPRQTVSLCMIAKDAATTIRKTIDSVCGVVQEVIVAIDHKTTDNTKQILLDADKAYPDITFGVIEGDSPLDIGFDEARNRVINTASGDWIMWLDADEEVINQLNIPKYLRNNEFLGYGMAQHHYAVEPLGVMKTDYPVRLFRNHKGIKFYGYVHEHPEIELNKQVGRAHIINDVDIVHTGYMTEAIRRKRFQRNVELMKMDREIYPERTLGKYLWIRDLAQMTRYELEAGYCPMETRLERSDEANRLWLELLEAGEIRMLVDSMDYYSFLNVSCDRGVKATFKCDFEKLKDPTLMDKKEIGGRFFSKEHVALCFNKIMDVKTEKYDSPWY